jgi:hypothetical protein
VIAFLVMSLGTGQVGWPNSAGAPVEFVRRAPTADVDDEDSRRVVIAFLPAMTGGLSAFPSLDLPLFVGGRLPGRAWALGYQFTFSSGGADRYLTGLAAHRHAVTALRRFGRERRYLVTLGGGFAFLWTQPVVEFEARIGWRFGKRGRGVYGFVARLGWNFGAHEQAPVPQLGLVLGVARR